jgi:hypothetical protein
MGLSESVLPDGFWNTQPRFQIPQSVPAFESFMRTDTPENMREEFIDFARQPLHVLPQQPTGFERQQPWMDPSHLGAPAPAGLGGAISFGKQPQVEYYGFGEGNPAIIQGFSRIRPLDLGGFNIGTTGPRASEQPERNAGGGPIVSSHVKRLLAMAICASWALLPILRS